MLVNYLKTSLRSIRTNKFYSVISVLGLAIGLATAVLILLWCQDERSYNNSVNDGEHVYRVIPSFLSNGNKKYFATTPAGIGYVSKQINGIEKSGRFIPNWSEMILSYKDKRFAETKSALIDPELFDILDIGFLKGNRNNPFTDTRSIIITETFAKKYFGNEDPIGKILTREDQKENYTVTGIVKTQTRNQLEFDFFIPLNILNELFGNPSDPKKGIDGDWKNYDFETYVRVHPGASGNAIASGMAALQKKNASDEITKTISYRLQPISEIHLYNPDGSDGQVTMVRIFTWVAIVILLIASINYVNLTTARAAQRAREIGVRKIIGAAKRQLFIQFLSESLVVFFIATALALLIMNLCLPLYNSVTGKELQFNLFSTTLWQVLTISVAGTLFASSVYPAILLSGFKPLQAIKGKFSIGRGNHYMRKVLVISQFSFSVIFIVSTLIIGRQLSYIQSRDIGINKDNVLRIEMKNIRGKFDAVKTQLLNEPSISGITGAGQNVLQVTSNTTNNNWSGKAAGQSLLITTLPIERNFLSVMNIPLKEGKGFTGTPSDSIYFILNETAVKEIGIKDPIGKEFTLYETRGIISGVVKDFHFNDLHQKIGPCVMFWKPEWINQLYVKTNNSNGSSAVSAVEKVWKEYNSDYPFTVSFLDDSYAMLYAADQRTSVLFRVFAVIAILISCLGLFGLITYTVQLKTREIGIRKVLGADSGSVTGLLIKDFVWLVIMAIIIASPIGWYLMDRWLQDFAYRSEIAWWIFPVAGLISLSIAGITIGTQAIKAAVANPVKSLRSE